MPDFSLLQNPDFGRAALSGYQAGQAIGKQRRLNQALQGLDLSRPETVIPVLREDPSTGAALIGASMKIHAEDRADKSRAAMANYIKSEVGSGAPKDAAPPIDPAAGMDAPAEMGGPAEITVTAPANPNAARNAAIDADPEAFMKLQPEIMKMDEARLKKLDEATEAAGAIWQNALSMPEPQRKAYIATQVPYLVNHGFPADRVSQIDVSDNGLHGEIGKAIGVKGMIDQANKARDDKRQDESAAETRRHNRVEEGQSAAREARITKWGPQPLFGAVPTKTDDLDY